MSEATNECDDNGENCDRCRGMKREDICDALGDARCVVESLRVYLWERETIAGNPEEMIRRALLTYDEIENERAGAALVEDRDKLIQCDSCGHWFAQGNGSSPCCGQAPSVEAVEHD
jgi:hypothetical protein